MNIKKEIMEEIKGMKVNQSNEGRENPLTKHKWWFNNGYDSAVDDIVKFLSQALTRIEEAAVDKSMWCQFCGDELSCFGCEGIPGRTMEENRKLLLASLSASEEKECKCDFCILDPKKRIDPNCPIHCQP